FLHHLPHARPLPRIRLPAWVMHLAVRHLGTSREEELAHLRLLAEGADLELEGLAGDFLRLRLGRGLLRWERHTEFSTYTLVQGLPETPLEGDPALWLAVDPLWLRGIPGRTILALELILVPGPVEEGLEVARRWLGPGPMVASLIGREQYGLVATDFRARASGLERIIAVLRPGTTETRAGRVAMRLLEMETYRMMASLGFPVARELLGFLQQAERRLAEITAEIRDRNRADAHLLDELEALAAEVEHLLAEHTSRFGASRAYQALVQERLAELREAPIPGVQTLGEFLNRRFRPAMTTVDSVANRLLALSERIAEATALLRTRVDIALEGQNQAILARIQKGQEMQYRLQRTVEGLSVAAISYYVLGLLGYGFKALKEAGLPLAPEVATGLALPLVVLGVWGFMRRIHRQLFHP
ncbi:DUF3422 family protein, partial [Thermus scotoductus]